LWLSNSFYNAICMCNSMGIIFTVIDTRKREPSNLNLTVAALYLTLTEDRGSKCHYYPNVYILHGLLPYVPPLIPFFFRHWSAVMAMARQSCTPPRCPPKCGELPPHLTRLLPCQINTIETIRKATRESTRNTFLYVESLRKS